jgi:copper chaperone
MSTYEITGMTCDHCVRSVREELFEIRGVDTVAVDLATGHVTVSGTHFSDEDVAIAVAEAGYGVAA